MSVRFIDQDLKILKLEEYYEDICDQAPLFDIVQPMNYNLELQADQLIFRLGLGLVYDMWYETVYYVWFYVLW